MSIFSISLHAYLVLSFSLSFQDFQLLGGSSGGVGEGAKHLTLNFNAINNDNALKYNAFLELLLHFDL
jgi:hypothetical protein